MAREHIVNYREVGQQRADPFAARNTSAIAAGFQDPRKDRELRLPAELHKAESLNPAQSMVGKVLRQTTELGDQTIKSGSLSLGAAFQKAKQILTSGIMGGNIGDLAKGLLGGALGLQTVRSLLSVPKFISDPASRKEHAPLLLNTVKLVIGASIACGLFGGLMGKVGFSPTGLGIGVAIYCVASLFSGLYKENSIFSKLLSALGLKENFVEVMDSMKIEESFYK